MCIEATRSHRDPGKGRAPWGQGMQPPSMSLYDLIAHFLLVLSNIPLIQHHVYSLTCQGIVAAYVLEQREPSTGSYSVYHHLTLLFWVLLLLECHWHSGNFFSLCNCLLGEKLL